MHSSSTDCALLTCSKFSYEVTIVYVDDVIQALNHRWSFLHISSRYPYSFKTSWVVFSPCSSARLTADRTPLITSLQETTSAFSHRKTTTFRWLTQASDTTKAVLLCVRWTTPTDRRDRETDRTLPHLLRYLQRRWSKRIRWFTSAAEGSVTFYLSVNTSVV